MAHSQGFSDRPTLARVGSLVAGSTLALTLALFGLITVAGGGTAGLTGRLPYYVLAAAVAFAAALIGLDRRGRDGRSLLGVALAAAVAAFVLVALGVEGVAYAAGRPAEALAVDTLPYVVATALVATGLAYWTTNHWQELARRARR